MNAEISKLQGIWNMEMEGNSMPSGMIGGARIIVEGR
jgi:hypothetical protein